MNSLDLNGYPLARQPSASEGRIPRRSRMLLSLLKGLKIGRLTLHVPGRQAGEEPMQFGLARPGQPDAQVFLKSWEPLEACIKHGDIGFAQAWIDGEWESPDLTAVLSLAVANRELIDAAVYGGWIGRLVFRIKHLLNRNTKRGAARNIHAHYDLGNDFYQLWLDRSMTYSSALFDGENRKVRSLETGQIRKYERIIEALALRPQSRILEIGSGWGGFAELAAKHGFHVKGLTLSQEQLNFAQQRVLASEQADRAAFALQDYRDEAGLYDGIASIEMFEAVGEAYWPQFFQTLAKCLKPGGRAVIQTITIRNDLFARYRLGSDFIQQFIFPGGMLPSAEVFERLAKAHGLEVSAALAFGADYAETLRQWKASFVAQLDQVRTQGFDQSFIRTWEFYLSYCEAAFERGCTDVVQFTLTKPKHV